jgi:phage-related protein
MRRIVVFKRYFLDFYEELDEKAQEKIDYALMLLKKESRLSNRFVKRMSGSIYELRAIYKNKHYRIFFVFDEGNIVVLFHGFLKKTRKTPMEELERVKRIKREYDEQKNGNQ